MPLDDTHSERQYWAFISHSHKDAGWASWLARGLEGFAVPEKLVGQDTPAGPAPRRLRPIFRDRDDLAANPDLRHQLHRVLDNSKSMIVVCSPDAVASSWVNEEIAYFRSVHGGERIFSIIVSGEPNAVQYGQSAALECFPAALRSGVEPNPEDLTDYVQPIASDLRPGGDGKRLALLKLVAGILGTELDDLVHRDAQRRHRQMAALAAGSFAGMLAMGGLAAVATSARNEAQRQRAQAEGLIEFMLVDLRKTLEPAGKLDALGSVGKRALQYYEAQKTTQLDADSLGRRSRVLHLIGDVNDQKGDLDSALKVFQEAAKSTGELLTREPDDPQRIYDHAQSVYWVGYVAARRRQTEQATQQFRLYLDLANRLVSIDPTSDDWQAEVGYANTNLGTVLLDAGFADQALAAFRRSQNIKLILVARQPGNRHRQVDLGQAYAWSADALVRLGDLTSAKSTRLEERRIYEGILSRSPQDVAVLDSLVVNRQKMALIYLHLEELPKAAQDMDHAVADVSQLLRIDSTNTAFHHRAVQSFMTAARVKLRQRQREEAAVLSSEALDLAEELAGRDASITSWVGQDLGRARNLAMRVAFIWAGSPRERDQALSEAPKEFHRLSILSREHPDDLELAAVAGEAAVLAGDSYWLKSDRSAAVRTWSEGMATVSRALGARRKNHDPEKEAVMRMLRKRTANPKVSVPEFAIRSRIHPYAW